MGKRSSFAVERVESASDERTKIRQIDKNFDDLAGISTSLEKRVSSIEKEIAGLGVVNLSSILNIILNLESGPDEFALMVGYE